MEYEYLHFINFLEKYIRISLDRLNDIEPDTISLDIFPLMEVFCKYVYN